ncbi:MAG: VWA domain-containing protein, partial [Anaerolineae bacterium]|nr:VWA domain-containing protein [Anaerolineae bacterium]
MASKIWDTHFAFFGLEKTANKAEVNHAYRSLLAEIETRDIPVSEKLEEIKRIDKIYEALIRLVAGEDEKEIDLEILTSRSCLEVLEEPQLLYALLSIRCCKNENNPVKRRKKICFLVDRSTSMQGDHINMVKANIERAIESLDEEDEISIVTFNDRAEIMLPLTAVRALRKGFLWNLTKTGGATEIYYGISAGLDQLMKVDVSECSRHLFLFTDGRTYGDEGACLELSKRAWEHQIPISTFGLGSEWNDEFLDQIAANSGGATEYITSNKDLKHHLEKHIYAMSDVMIRGLEIKYRLPDGVNLLFGYLISQKPSQLILDGLLQIGSLHFREHVQVILEFLVAPTTQQDGLL